MFSPCSSSIIIPRETFACKFLSSVTYRYIWYVKKYPCAWFTDTKNFFSFVIVFICFSRRYFLRRFLYIGFAYTQGESLKRFLKIPICQIILFTSYVRVLSRLTGRARVNHFLPYPGKLLYRYIPTFIWTFTFYEMIHTWSTPCYVKHPSQKECIGDAMYPVMEFFSMSLYDAQDCRDSFGQWGLCVEIQKN